MKKRLFIALSVPENTRRQLFDELKPLIDRDRRIRQVPFRNMHITLKFLGDTDLKTMEKIKCVLDKISENFEEFYYRIGVDPDAFPGTGSARIIYASVNDGQEKMKDIFLSVENALAEIGIRKESRGFIAHITLARLSMAMDLAGLLESVRLIVNEPVKCSEILLVESILGTGGAEYVDLGKYKFVVKN
jgi:RNA 2',3'-cyclic 3'-phosphodiesterase